MLALIGASLIQDAEISTTSCALITKEVCCILP